MENPIPDRSFSQNVLKNPILWKGYDETNSLKKKNLKFYSKDTNPIHGLGYPQEKPVQTKPIEPNPVKGTGYPDQEIQNNSSLIQDQNNPILGNGYEKDKISLAKHKRIAPPSEKKPDYWNMDQQEYKDALDRELQKNRDL